MRAILIIMPRLRRRMRTGLARAYIMSWVAQGLALMHFSFPLSLFLFSCLFPFSFSSMITAVRLKAKAGRQMDPLRNFARERLVAGCRSHAVSAENGFSGRAAARQT